MLSQEDGWFITYRSGYQLDSLSSVTQTHKVKGENQLLKTKLTLGSTHVHRCIVGDLVWGIWEGNRLLEVPTASIQPYATLIWHSTEEGPKGPRGRGATDHRYLKPAKWGCVS